MLALTLLALAASLRFGAGSDGEGGAAAIPIASFLACASIPEDTAPRTSYLV